jgi:hypothetical protein
MSYLRTLGPLALLGLAACSSSSRAPLAFPPEDTGGADTGGADSSEPVDVGADSSIAKDGTADAGESSLEAGDSASVDSRDADVVVDSTPTTAVPADSGGTDATDAEAGPPGICDPLAPFATSTALTTLSSTKDDLLGAVTPDELTIAWSSVDSAANVTVYSADRASAATAFGAPLAVAVPTAGFVVGRVGLSPDGLRLLFVSKNAKSMYEIVRVSRSGAFDGSPDPSAFGAINALIGDGSGLLGFPLVGSDDLSLYFTLGNPTGGNTIYRANRASSADHWSNPSRLGDPALVGGGATAVVPTGVSKDDRTLFLWAVNAGHAYASDRTSPGGPFTTLVDLGARQYASPAGDCKTLYYSAAGAIGGLDLTYGR